MRRTLLFPLALLSVAAWGDESYIGLYLQGQKIGWTSLYTSDITYEGKPAKKADSRMMLGAQMLGGSMSFTMDSTTISTPSGKPIRMKFKSSSAGRVQEVDAVFSNTN